MLGYGTVRYGTIVQSVMFAENRLAPCMGSTVCEEYAGKDGADAAATWVVLKACVAEWELRLRYVNDVQQYVNLCLQTTYHVLGIDALGNRQLW